MSGENEECKEVKKGKPEGNYVAPNPDLLVEPREKSQRCRNQQSADTEHGIAGFFGAVS